MTIYIRHTTLIMIKVIYKVPFPQNSSKALYRQGTRVKITVTGKRKVSINNNRNMHSMKYYNTVIQAGPVSEGLWV